MEEGLSSFRPVLNNKIMNNRDNSKLLAKTYIFDFLHSKVAISRYANGLRSNVNDDHHWSRDKSFEKVIDFQVRRS